MSAYCPPVKPSTVVVGIYHRSICIACRTLRHASLSTQFPLVGVIPHFVARERESQPMLSTLPTEKSRYTATHELLVVRDITSRQNLISLTLTHKNRKSSGLRTPLHNRGSPFPMGDLSAGVLPIQPQQLRWLLSVLAHSWDSASRFFAGHPVRA